MQNGMAKEPDISLRRLNQGKQHADCSAFPCAVRPKEPKDIAAVYNEIEIADRPPLAKALAERGCLKDSFGGQEVGEVD